MNIRGNTDSSMAEYTMGHNKEASSATKIACLIWNSSIEYKSVHQFNRKNPKALNKVTKCHTMLVQDSFLGNLLVLPVELWKGIAG